MTWLMARSRDAGAYGFAVSEGAFLSPLRWPDSPDARRRIRDGRGGRYGRLPDAVPRWSASGKIPETGGSLALDLPEPKNTASVCRL